ncbi:MAG: T9SS type A sorting domain-containing protein [Ignavibacteria bacterium]|nr:T9SS type A sorting domain-containing protein [Ignavibacteria bacterium]
MKKKITFMAVMLAVTVIAFAGEPYGSSNAPGQDVSPFTVNLSTLPPPVNSPIMGETHERGRLPDYAIRDYIAPYITPQVDNPSDGPAIYTKGWAGPNQNGWQPADADIAVGPLHVVVVTNEQFHIYARNNSLSLLQTNTFQNFCNRPGKSLFDPKVIYDPWRNRWVMLVLEKEGLLSYYWVIVSQTNNPTGNWWIYKLNAHVDGSTTTSNWADYPGLGFTGFTGNDSTTVVITSNQYNQSNSFQYAKIRILKGKQLFAGAPVGWWDYINMQDQSGNKSFTIKPAAQWFSTSNGTIYLLNTKSGSGSVITVWRINNPTWWSGGISITRQSTITVNAYSIPTDMKQPGSVRVDAFDCRTQDVTYMVGKNTSNVNKAFLYTAIPSKYIWTAADTNSVLNYYKLNITDNTVDVQGSIGLTGFWYTFPKPVPMFRSPYVGDSVYIAFTRGSSTTYAETRVISHDKATGFGGSVLIQSGTGHYGGTRFGDYSGAAIDPAQNGRAYITTMRNRSGGWGTGIGLVSPTVITGLTPNNELTPKKFELSQNYPNPFNPTTIINFALPTSSKVTLKVYNVLGEEVASLVNSNLTAGTYNYEFDASNLSAGVYFYRLRTDNFTETKKMMLVK